MKKQQIAFVSKNKMLKGALHCHTTRSDGEGTPEATIRYHYDHGYDFISLTDHRIYNYKNFAPDVPITIIPGMEFDSRSFKVGGYGGHTFHTVCIGPSREDGNGFEQDEVVLSAVVSCQEEYQPFLDEIHAKNNLTILCHPEWSCTPPRLFEKLKGDFAMEICNTGSIKYDDMDMDAPYWDEILGQGIRMLGVAADDGHYMSEHCLGWVMVNAENNVNAILEALKTGAFYSSCGPEIYNFCVENDTAYIDCSPVSTIRLHNAGFPTELVRDPDGNLTHAEFKLRAPWTEKYRYVRMTIVDKNGDHAWTNPIFAEE
ncbi:MAG: hypothetical protein E7337_03930 [Clostridiales bacterium]|nr:hypothetical protein [Clostridiales bacterium]